jgi:hypothetical protein
MGLPNANSIDPDPTMYLRGRLSFKLLYPLFYPCPNHALPGALPLPLPITLTYIRRKKNADSQVIIRNAEAQAISRARKASYITTLEDNSKRQVRCISHVSGRSAELGA